MARRSRLVYGKVFRKGGRLVRYGYRNGRKVGLFAYKAARIYSKARYTYRQGEKAYQTYRTVRKYSRRTRSTPYRR